MEAFINPEKWIDWFFPVVLMSLLKFMGPSVISKIKALFRFYRRRELLKIKRARWCLFAIYSAQIRSYACLILFVLSGILLYYLLLATPLQVKFWNNTLGFWMCMLPVLISEVVWLYQQGVVKDLIKSAKRVGVV